jgi:dipeptidyl-peptidase-4
MIQTAMKRSDSFTQPVLTLTLSQRERGPEPIFSQRERGLFFPLARFLTKSLAILVCFNLCASLPAQGTKADYERANALRKLTANKVFKSRVKPNWSADNTRFWYRNDLGDEVWEFILVDAVKGTREPAFDHEKMAKSLGKVLEKEVDARRLPIDEIDFIEDDPNVVLLHVDGKIWHCDLKNYELREAKSEEKPLRPLRSRPALRESKSTGEETSLTFINRTKAEVEIFWLDEDGNRQSYGKIKPGDKLLQHTYAGHAWLVADADGKTLAVYEAEEQPASVVVDGTQPPQDRPRRRFRGPRPEGAASPDGQWFAFFKDHNVYLRDTESREEFALSDDGSADDEYSGEVFWSPDSKKLAVLRTKKGDERKVQYVESSPKDQLQPKLHSYDYLKPGDKIPLSKPQLFEVAGRKHIPIPDELFPNPWSISDVHWDPDSSRFLFLYNQRGHQIMRVLAADAAAGKVQTVVEEQSPTFIDYSGKQFLQYLDESGEIVWMSERDGWNHLYLFDAKTGGLKNQITKGPWVVRSVEKVDEPKRQIYFYAGGVPPEQDPYYIHYCRVNFDGSGLTALTEGDGTHSIKFSPDRRFFIDTFSRVDLPPVNELRRIEDGALICKLEQADWSGLIKTGWKIPERFVAKGRDGTTDIYGVIFRPTNFDPAKKYPVIELIYAGPQDSFVPKSFSSFHSPQTLAELGFILVQIDGMGTSNRSKKFHVVCWKNLGDAGFPDRIPWIKAAAEKYPYMDTSRVGIYGVSAGGQSAARAVLAFGDFYKAAVADCGCHDNRMDKIWWNEQWMSWPLGPHYEEQSNVTQAHKLQGKLMLCVGEMDENVDPASTMQVVNALIKADKDFDLIVFPGKGHGAGQSPYGERRRADFFVRNLLGVEPRGEK